MSIEKRVLQSNELDELILLYKERTKQCHDKHIMKKRFEEGDLILLFKSKLQLFRSKLRSQWSGQFKVIKVFSHEAVDI